MNEALDYLNYHWGDVYVFDVAADKYIAVAKFGEKDTLEADSADELLRKVRLHYRGPFSDMSSL